VNANTPDDGSSQDLTEIATIEWRCRNSQRVGAADPDR